MSLPSDDAIRAAMDPTSDFPEPDLRSSGQQEHIKQWVGPAGSSMAMKLTDASRVKQGYSQGEDLTEGINREVGAHIGGQTYGGPPHGGRCLV